MNELTKTEPANPSEITTAEVLAEVERRQEKTRRLAVESRGVTPADRLTSWLVQHWLALFNGFILLYVGLPILAPVLMALDVRQPAMVIYTIYRPLCHQLPQRSFFLFGPQLTYTAAELAAWIGKTAWLDATTAAFVGNEAAGYKVALCQRDVAIYGAILLSGLAYGVLRRWWKVRSLPWWAYVAFGIAPMLVDGGYQMLSYMASFFWPAGPLAPHETTLTLRVITGALFGVATTWLAYPVVQEAMDEFHGSLKRRQSMTSDPQLTTHNSQPT